MSQLRETSEVIKEKINAIACEYGYSVSSNVDKIVKAKLMFFGEDEWQHCPCDKDNNLRGCISEKCHEDVATSGKCHCNLFLKA